MPGVRSTQLSSDPQVNYRKNRTRSDRYDGVLANIVRRHTPVYLSTPTDDRLGIDAWVPETTYAFRVRDPRYLSDFGNEFTIRTRSGHGGKTEIDNVRAGTCDRDLYAFLGDGFAAYHLLDLHKVATVVDTQGVEKVNRDGSALKAYDVRKLPHGSVIASTIRPELSVGNEDSVESLWLCRHCGKVV